MSSVARFFLCIVIALVPMLVVALVAFLTGYAPIRDAIEAVIVTAILLGFVAYRRRAALTNVSSRVK